MDGMTGLIAAAVLAALSSAAYAGAAVAQQRVGGHERGERSARSRTSVGRAIGWMAFLLAERGWWLAVALNLAGAILHVAALRYGPLTLVQPLGALTLVLAVPLAALTASRRVGRGEWHGAVITVVGLAGIFALTSTEAGNAKHALDQGGVLALTVATVFILLVLIYAGRIAGGAAASLLYATAAGASFAVASVLTKTITLLVGRHPDWSLLWLAGGATAVLAIAGLLLSQSAYQDAEVGAPTAAITLINPVVAAAIGLTLLGERLVAGTTGALLALGFALIAGWGVIVLVVREGERDREPAGPQDDPERCLPTR
jgi:drug/metabolite transporter (DMT)-like permease